MSTEPRRRYTMKCSIEGKLSAKDCNENILSATMYRLYDFTMTKQITLSSQYFSIF